MRQRRRRTQPPAIFCFTNARRIAYDQAHPGLLPSSCFAYTGELAAVLKVYNGGDLIQLKVKFQCDGKELDPYAGDYELVTGELPKPSRQFGAGVTGVAVDAIEQEQTACP